MAKLTEEQKQKYLTSRGILCPFCGSNDVQGDSIEVDGGYCTQDIEIERCMNCNVCNEEWTDVYMLTCVETDADREAK